jgi:hypothetical protein
MTAPKLPVTRVHQLACNYDDPIHRSIAQIISSCTFADDRRRNRARHLAMLVEASQRLICHATAELEREVDRMQEIDRK